MDIVTSQISSVKLFLSFLDEREKCLQKAFSRDTNRSMKDFLYHSRTICVSDCRSKVMNMVLMGMPLLLVSAAAKNSKNFV